MSVLITGGAGYIGSHVNRALREAGYDTIVLDDLSDGHREAVLSGGFFEGDYGDRILLDQIFAEHDIDAVIHLAAFASVPDSVIRPARYYMNNVSKMETLLSSMVEHGVRYMVFSSSAATFGKPLYTPIDEAHPQNPINPYGTTKLIDERMLYDYSHAYGLRFCALRYFCAAGASKDAQIGEAHSPETHLIPVMIKAALTGKPFEVFGDDYPTPDGFCIRDFIHVLDIADAHIKALEYLHGGGSSVCLNLGSEHGYSVVEMIGALSRITGEPVPYRIASRREGDPESLVASSKKASEVLQWNASYSAIDEILSDALRWQESKKY